MVKAKPFEEHTSQYENWFALHGFAYESELEAVRRQLPHSGAGIEIGAGSGRFAAPLGIELGLEPSANMSKIAQERGINIVRGIAEAIPFRDSSFDFALMVTTICFVDDLMAALKELYRILKPGGYLINAFIDRDSPIGQLYERNKRNNVFYQYAVFYSAGEIASALEETGFENLTFSQTLFRSLSRLDRVEPAKAGYGEGSFVTIKARK